MKRKIALGCVLLMGCVVSIMGLMPKKEKEICSDYANYKSSINMTTSLDDIKKHIVTKYSKSKSNDYVGTATISVTYDSFGVIGENISQTYMNLTWNNGNPGKEVKGTCTLVANTMLFRKYISQYKLKQDSNEMIFAGQVIRGWQLKILTNDKRGGLSASQGKTIADEYLKSKSSSLRGNLDVFSKWSTLKKYLNDKIEPVVIHLEGMKPDGEPIAHAVLATDCYTLTVKYTKKNIFGRNVSDKELYNVIRVCNGWENTDLKDFEKTTYSYIYEDCMVSLMKLD